MLFAQSPTATINGRITDPRGQAIPGAKVQATNIDTNVTYPGQTNDEGFYNIVNLPPGKYRVVVEKEGFSQIVKPDVQLHVQDIAGLNFAMQVGSVTQSITVEGGAPLLSTESAAVGTVVDRQFVANMPMNGRSFQSLILLSPGIVPTPASTTNSGQFSVNGQRTTTNYFSVDGVSANIGAAGSGSAGLFDAIGGGAQPVTAVGGYNGLVSIDAIQEFRVQTSSVAPEFGRTPGGQFEIVTRSGTNHLHGTVFDYLRNDVFDANNWFTNRSGQPKPPERQNDFGGTFSGPVRLPSYSGRNRTFFFFSYEGLRLRRPSAGVTEVPSLAQRQTATSFYQPLLNAFPLPNGPTQADGFGLLSVTYSNPSNVDASSLRLDHTVNPHLTLFGRYNYSPSVSETRGTSNVSPSVVTKSHVLTQTLSVGATLTLNNAATNDLRLNYSRNTAGTAMSLDTFGGASPIDPLAYVPSSISGNILTALLVQGGNSTWITGALVDNLQRQLNLVDTASVSRKSHHFKVGIDYRRLTPEFNPLSYELSLTAAPTDLTKTNLARMTVATQQPATPAVTNVSLFAQDAWHIGGRVVATYGLRWELNPPPSFDGTTPIAVAGFTLANPSAATVAPLGAKLYQTTYRNFAPRIGIAYELRRDPNTATVIRGGFGYFYDLGTSPIGSLLGGPPYTATRTQTNIALPLTAAQLAPPVPSTAPPFSNVSAIDPSLKLPYTLQWNVSVEQGLGQNQSVTASYVAAAGRNLLTQFNLPLPNSSFTTSFSYLTNLATSDYDSLQIEFQRRLSQGVQALGSYTWQHSIDVQSGDLFSSTSAPARGNSSFDIRHRASGALTFDLPGPKQNPVARAILGGWGLDPIFSIQSAAPVDLVGVSNVDINGLLLPTRPNVVSGIPFYLYGPQYPGGKIINNTPNQGGTGCKGPFCAAPAGQQGNLGRNVIRAYPISQVDLSLRRQFRIKERLNLQWRCDAFNVFNHPNFGSPNAILSSALFGTPANMYGTFLGPGGIGGGLNPLYQLGGPRSLQLSARLTF